MERIAEGEYAVMEVLWEQAPLTAAEVADRVPADRGWTLATVKTMLSRLLAKGVLDHQQDGRRYLYRPLVAREDYVAAESQGLLDRLFEGRLAPLVSHFSERQRLSPRDIADLKRLIQELDDGQ